MKSYFLFFTVFLTIFAFCSSSPVQQEAGELEYLNAIGHEARQAPRIFRRSTECDYRACDQLCRRLKFPGGACIGDKCDCDKF